jgi:hypothetical protein
MLRIERLAPPSEIVRYLAVFERCFRFIHTAGVHRDRDAMLLGGHLANELHNVPALLCRFDLDDWHRGDRFQAELRLGYRIPEYHGAPPATVQACRRLLAPEWQPGELGLEADLSALDLAPPEKLVKYLERLYDACIHLRIIRNYGFPPPDEEYTGTFWITSDANWVPDGDQRGVDNGVLAERCVWIPKALVSWGHGTERTERT